jgi:hypothetical protein
LAGASSIGTVTCASSILKEVYNPKAVIPHAASLHQACAHCAIFPTAASRRSLGRISVPVWPDTLSGRLPVVALVGHHPTNKLIGRGPIPHRKSFPPPGHATSRVYSVLDPVSQAYPKVQGRSPTCYSPVRHSCTPKGLTVRLACVKHAASVRPEPESNSPNKNNPSKTGEFESEKSDQAPVKTGNDKTNHTPQQEDGESPTRHGKKQQTKTTKHTIEFSNNTPDVRCRPRNQPHDFRRVLVVRTAGTPRIPGLFPEGRRRALRATASQRLDQVTSVETWSQIAC